MEVLSLLTPDGRVFFSLVPALVDPLASAGDDPTPLADAVHPDDAQIVRQVLAELLEDPDTPVAFRRVSRRKTGGAGLTQWPRTFSTNHSSGRSW